MDAAALLLRSCLRESESLVDPKAESRHEDGAWDVTFGATVQELAGVIRALGVPHDRAPDVLHDVYVAMRQKGPTHLAGDNLRRWLFRVTANRCRLEHRQNNRARSLLERLTNWVKQAPSASEAAAEQRELSARVDAALARLKEVEREVVVLRYFCGLNSREVGEALAMPEATVRSHLAKARRQLARDLAEFE